MISKLNGNTINQFKAGTVLYKQGEKVVNIGVVIEGKVIVYNQGTKMIVGPGSFIGMNDLFELQYMSNYIAYEDVALNIFEISDIDFMSNTEIGNTEISDIENCNIKNNDIKNNDIKNNDIKDIMNSNKDYNALLVSYFNKNIIDLSNTYRLLKIRVDELFEFAQKVSRQYAEICKVKGYPLSKIKDDSMEKYKPENTIDEGDLLYYLESSKLPEDIKKSYFSYNSNLTFMYVKKQVELVNKLIKESIHITNYGKDVFEIIYSDKSDCLFKELAKVIMDIKTNGGTYQVIINLLDKVKNEIDKTDKLFAEKSGCKLRFNRERIDEIYSSLIAVEIDQTLSTDIQLNYSSILVETAIEEMKDSLDQILNYAELKDEKKLEIKQNILEFKGMKDKTAISDNARSIRKHISEDFYDLYLIIYEKSRKEENISRIIILFLDYGFIDETLLTKNQCVELYCLSDDNNHSGKCGIYTISKWLDQIFEGKKQPSKNEFDLDYNENLRELKKSAKVSAEEEKEYLTNPIRKVEYEIKNMFRYNNRVVSGQIMIFVPILYHEVVNKEFINMFYTTNAINAAIDRLSAIDYSAFYREVLYYDNVKGIDKQYIVKQVFPDIILMPTLGSNSVMWQDIEGRKRDTSGRFILPIFCETDLFEQLVKLTGRLRFELCRTIEGISWNNVQQKSLTSEYSDYVQSYSKNRDLSEENKLKIKKQIAKCRNNIREFFVLDYITWIQNESQGYLRLNKVARAIMCTYCPFAKEFRERHMKQPFHEEAMTRYVREKQKKIKECSSAISKLKKDNIVVPIEMEQTLIFYSDL